VVAQRRTGCAHSQQLIWQLFNAIEKGFIAAGDSDLAFLDGMWNVFLFTEVTYFVSCAYETGNDGQGSSDWSVGSTTRSAISVIELLSFALVTVPYTIEWKIDMDRPTDTHRHLSHLIGVRLFYLTCPAR